jgi:hypothetical protein
LFGALKLSVMETITIEIELPDGDAGEMDHYLILFLAKMIKTKHDLKNELFTHNSGGVYASHHDFDNRDISNGMHDI